MSKVIAESTKTRLLRKLRANADNTCIEYTGCLDTYGYGLFRVGGRLKKAHRLAFEMFVGPIPEELQVMHICDNRKCCNPAHLRLGTLLDNMRDRNRKGRQAKGERNRHKLTEEQVMQIRELSESIDSTAEIRRKLKLPVKWKAVNDVICRVTWRHV